MWIFAAFIVLSSMIAVAYVWRMVEALYLAEAPGSQTVQALPMSLSAALWILSLATIYFGIFTDVTFGVADVAASGLMSGSSGMR